MISWLGARSRATSRQVVAIAALLLSIATVSVAIAAYNMFLNHESFYSVTILTTLIWILMFLLAIAIAAFWSVLAVWWFFRGMSE